MADIAEAKAQPMGDDEIRRILGQDMNVIPYPKFGEMSSIDEAFDDKGRCIFLYLMDSTHSGHFCCLLKQGDTIEYFDPYGFPPDYPLRLLSSQKRQEYGETDAYLTHLLRRSGKKIVYNKKNLQKKSDDVATCGRHTVARCLYNDVGLGGYLKELKKCPKGMNPDDFVVGLTESPLEE
jgi:hypothetical protein